jgi:hypothetical protein
MQLKKYDEAAVRFEKLARAGIRPRSSTWGG